MTALQNSWYHFSRLVALSFGLQDAIHRRTLDVGYFFTRCYASATGILRIAKDDMAALGILEYAPNSIFIAISYAAVSLLRYSRPQFRSIHNSESTIVELVQLTGDMLDKQSGRLPGQYASFLRNIVRHHSLDVSGDASMRSAGSSTQTAAGGGRGTGGELVPSLFDQDEQTVRRRAHAALEPTVCGANDQQQQLFKDQSFDDVWNALLLPGFGMLDQAREIGLQVG
jgi:hypothetical protein